MNENKHQAQVDNKIAKVAANLEAQLAASNEDKLRRGRKNRPKSKNGPKATNISENKGGDVQNPAKKEEVKQDAEIKAKENNQAKPEPAAERPNSAPIQEKPKERQNDAVKEKTPAQKPNNEPKKEKPKDIVLPETEPPAENSHIGKKPKPPYIDEVPAQAKDETSSDYVKRLLDVDEFSRLAIGTPITAEEANEIERKGMHGTLIIKTKVVDLEGNRATIKEENAGYQSLVRLDTGEIIELTNSPFSIGCEQPCDYLLEERYVSRKHASIIREGDTFYIRDENSTNGTFVNGVKLNPNERVILNKGDTIKLAVILFSFGN